MLNYASMSSLAAANCAGAWLEDNNQLAGQLPVRYPGVKKYFKIENTSMNLMLTLRDIWEVWRLSDSWKLVLMTMMPDCLN